MVRPFTGTIILLIALSLFPDPVVFSQTTSTGELTGVVMDPQGAVIPGAEILVRNSRTGSEFRIIANEFGAWTKSGLPAGIYTVRIAAPGFRDFVQEGVEVGPKISATVNSTLQIELVENKVLVTASKYEQEVIDAPATATVISEQMIQALPTQNVADLLRTVPGMNVVQMSATAFGITSRAASGASPINQLVLIDGFTNYVDYNGQTLWEGSPGLDEIKQVEVIRGPASAIWGSYAMNGVVNIITKSPREMLGSSFTLGAGTFDRSGGGAKTDTGALFYARASHGQALNDRWAFRVAGGAYTQDAFARPQGNVPNDFQPPTPYPPYTNKGTTRPMVSGRLDYDHPDGKQHVTFNGAYSRSNGLYPGGAGGLEENGWAGFGKAQYSRNSLRITGFVQSGAFKGKMLIVQDPAGLPVRWDGKSSALHLELSDYRTLAAKHLVSYGGNIRHAIFKDLSFAPGAKNRTEGGAYLQGDFQISQYFRWVVGARIDKFDNLKGVVFAPRTSFIMKPLPSQTFRISYNRAFLAPSLYWTNTELYVSGLFPIGGDNYYRFPFCFCGNPELKEQSLNAYEAGYSATIAKGRVGLGAAFYINDSRGDFSWPQTKSYTSQNPPPGWPLPPETLDWLIMNNIFGPGMGLPAMYVTANGGKVRNMGLELNADARFNRHLTGYVNYSWQADPESTNNWVTNLPPSHRVNAGMDFDYRRYLGNVSIGYVDSAYWTDILSAQYNGWTKAYTTVNVSGGIRWGEGWKYTVMLRVSNLANATVQNHVYGDILKRQISGELRVQLQ